MTIEAQIAEGLSDLGLVLGEDAPRRLAGYLELIGKWNRVHNLTAIREPDQMVTLHLLDSLVALPQLAGRATLLDVGSGAGLPGIPLAITRPDLAVTLLDSSHKKAAFLRQAKTELALANVTVECERVERWRPGRTFEIVISRAFAELAEFVASTAHLLSPGGRMVAMKGVHPFDEIEKLPPSHRVHSVVEVAVPRLEAKRHLVILEAV